VVTAVALRLLELGGAGSRLDDIDDVDAQLVEVLVELRLGRGVQVQAVERLADLLDAQKPELLAS
jgi:hypothetical protein